MEVRVSDREWDFISQFLSPHPHHHTGRPPADDRSLFEGILWILATGSQWAELPDEYPAKSSCHRRFQAWSADGSWLRLRRALTRRLHKMRRLHLHEGFIDGSFIKAKKGAQRWHSVAI